MIRLAIGSDYHLEVERDWLRQIAEALGRKDDSRLYAVLERYRERDALITHPRLGPDLHDLADIDLYLLAGDIDKGTAAVEHAAEAAAFLHAPVVLVPGNHEFYGWDMENTLADMRAMAASTKGRLSVLDMERRDFLIRDRKLIVLGATLWTDYALLGDDIDSLRAAMQEAEHRLNDHNYILLRGRRFTAADAHRLHEQALSWLDGALAQAVQEDAVVVVVTHHAPTGEANPPQYRNGELSPAFASDLSALISRHQPPLWICGHTHHSFETAIGNCRIIGSMRGYCGLEPSAETFIPRVITI
jgi:hypothetical protein